MAKRAKEFRKPPYYKRNVADMFGSMWWQRMTSEQRGWFNTMLDRNWDADKCLLVNDESMLPMYAGVNPQDREEMKRFSESGWIVLQRFETTADGRFIYNKRLMDEYEALLAFRLECIRGGKNSAKARKTLKEIQMQVQGTVKVPSTDPQGTGKQTEIIDQRSEIIDQRQEKIKSVSSAASAEPIAGTLPLIDGSDYEVTKAEEAMWQGLFPAVEVKQAFRNMKAWLIAHEKNRKTPRGIKKFIQGWLMREQDSARPERANGTGTSKATERKARQQAGNRYAFREIVGGDVDDGGRNATGVSAGPEGPLGEVVDAPSNRDG